MVGDDHGQPASHNVSRCSACGEAGEPIYNNLRDRRLSAPGTWGILRCRGCTLHWLNPRPDPEAMPELYANYYTHASEATEGVGGRTARLRDAVLAGSLGYSGRRPRSPAWRAAGRLAALVGPLRETVEMGVMGLRGPAAGRLLDVGCGSGRFLRKMQALGWDVEGVELDEEAVAIARHSGLTVHAGELRAGLLPDSSFDAITLNHVIEHVPSPRETLSLCARALRPGGRLVVATPNVEGWGHRRFGDKWFHLDVPRHLFLFGPETLRQCMVQAGLEVVHAGTASRSASLVWAARHGGGRGFRILSQGMILDRVAGMAYLGVEHLASRFDPGVAEELVVTATVHRESA
ncbi:MAG: hypothetical protein DHS20C21_15330 [Gemmatimonadota bacterium]|nr:MAG: hypothetical protein DHS20C21_15330 [Gemmatimonadota bacterium]